MERSDAGSGKRSRAWLGPLLCLLTALAFGRVLAGGFVYDDHLTVGRNPAAQEFGALVTSLGRPMWDFTGPEGTPAVGYWRPLASIALFTAHRVGGGDALAFHALSLALHVLATWAAFRLARRISGDATCAFFAALLFGVHPVHVEAVAWLSSINEPLCGLFVLLALDAFLAWRERGSSGRPWLAGLWFLLALGSKELAIATVPGAIALDLARRVSGRERTWVPCAIRAYGPFLLALGAWYVARAAVFGSVLAGFDRTTTEYGVSTMRLVLLRIEIAGRGLGLALWPHPLRVFHPFVPAASWTKIGPAALVCLLWAVLVFVAWRKRSFAFLAGVLLAPVTLAALVARVSALGVFPLAERYLYVAVFGATLVAALVLLALVPRKAGLVLLSALALALSWRSHERIAIWTDERTLLTTAVLEAPRSPYAHRVLGKLLLEEYRRTQDRRTLVEALVAFETTLELGLAAQRGDQTIFAVEDDFIQANVGKGWALLCDSEVEGRSIGEAKAIFGLVTQRYPGSPEGWTARGTANALLGDHDAARQDFQKALSIDSRYVEAHNGLGVVYMRQGEFQKAAGAFEEALRLRPNHVDYLLMLARAKAESGDEPGARAVIDRARSIAPEDPRPRVLVGILHARHGDLDAAQREFDAVLERAPNDADAWLQKSKVLLRKGEMNGARRALLRAAECDTTSYEAHYNAGALILQMEGLSPAMPFLTRAYELRSRGESGRKLREFLFPLPIQSSVTLRTLATIDADRGDVEGALQWIERALAIDPIDARALTLKGAMLRRKGDLRGAVAALDEACDYEPKNLLGLMELGEIHEALGEKEAAREAYSRALVLARENAARDPDAQGLDRALEERIARLDAP